MAKQQVNARAVWAIDPLLGVGPIRFGMPIDTVRALVGAHATPFSKSDEGKQTDAFDELGLHAFYDRDGCCEAVEFFDWGQIEPALNAMSLLSEPYVELEQRIRELDAGTKLQLAGLVSLRCGLGIYVDAPTISGDIRARSVIVVKSGYYDDVMGALEGLARP